MKYFANKRHLNWAIKGEIRTEIYLCLQLKYAFHRAEFREVQNHKTNLCGLKCSMSCDTCSVRTI